MPGKEPTPPVASLVNCRRTLRVSDDGWEIRADSFSDQGAECLFLRNRDVVSACLRLEGGYSLKTCPAGGWLFLSRDPGQPVYWLPVNPASRALDDQGHILREADCMLGQLSIEPDALTVEVASPEGGQDWVVWRFDPRVSPCPQELFDLSTLETQPIFLWGSHTAYRRPADLYRHLVHGWVYENRYAWPFQRKICSENDAHALYVTLCGMDVATGKDLYRMLRQQLLLSLLERQSEDGGFRHGEWTNDMEAHMRLHNSAMHAFMDASEEFPQPDLRHALQQGIGFIAGNTDRLRPGVWFLHDELERSVSTMSQSPQAWIRSRALGKSESNMLVLNTHLDAMVAVRRYARISDDNQYDELVKSARGTARCLLQAQPLEWLYRPMFRAFALNFLPARRAAALPLPVRACKRLSWQYLVPLLEKVRNRFPRLVMPGGYIDRGIGIRGMSYRYLSINTMDIVRALRCFPEDRYLESILQRALEFAFASGIMEKWRDRPQDRYPLGFLAETLYQACCLSESVQLRGWLADCVLALTDEDMGLPPSVLGANAEILPPHQRLPCPAVSDPAIRVINMVTGHKQEILLVNTDEQARQLVWESAPAADLTWSGPDGAALELPVTIPGRAWVRGYATRQPGTAEAAPA